MFVPENTLEHSLVKAVADISHRPQFYRDVLAADVYVVSPGHERLPIDNGVIAAGSQLQLHTWENEGNTYVPVFSSVRCLSQSLTEEASYLQLPMRSLLEITRGSHVILNPQLDYGKEFTPNEITSMLDGTVFSRGQRHVVEKDTKVLIGQPRDYPHELVKALSSHFRKHRAIRAAYLAHVFNPEIDDKAHTVIGIDADYDILNSIGDAGLIASEFVGEGQVVDFMQLDGTGLSSYMKNDTAPFYKRTLLGDIFN